MTRTSIPKIIHYCWFGSNHMDKVHIKCIKSWEKNLPGFKFMKWDESNTEINAHPFLKTAYQLGKWAFVADFVRLQKLYEYGGIYLDTDMLILKPLDDLLLTDSFIGAEKPDFISCGIIGSIKGNSFINRCLLQYDDVSLDDNTNLGTITIPQLITQEFRSTYNYQGDFSEIIEVPGMAVFPPHYFYSLPYNKRNIKDKLKYLTKDAYGVHLWDESWKNHSEFTLLRKGKYLKGFKKISQNIGNEYSYKYLKRIFTALIKSRI